MKTRACACAGILLLLAVGSPVRADAPVGLVLSGGGALGAYEIGAWKAICARGLDRRIVAISGTSVGGINATLFASVRDPAQCERIWRESIVGAFHCNTNTVRRGVQASLDALDRHVARNLEGAGNDTLSKGAAWAALLGALAESVASAAGVVSNATEGAGTATGVCESSGLRAVLERGIPRHPLPVRPDVYVTAVNKARQTRREFHLNGLPHAQVIDRLMATAAIPVAFDAVVIDGEPYVDGGYELIGGDNVPIGPILKHHPEIRTILVVYLDAEKSIPRRLSRKDCPGARLVEVIPSTEVGGVLGMFDTSTAVTDRLIGMGFADTLKALDGGLPATR